MTQFAYMSVDFFLVATDENDRFYPLSSFDWPLIMLNDGAAVPPPSLDWKNLGEYNTYVRNFITFAAKLHGVVGKVMLINYDKKNQVTA